MKKLLTIPLLLLVYACSPSLKIQEVYHSEDMDFKHMQNSKITIYGVNSISLDEFVKTFNDEYSDTAKLNDKIISTFINEFSKLIPSVKPVGKNEKLPSVLSGEFSIKESNTEEVVRFFEELEADYLIFINHINVGNSYDSYFYATGHGISGSKTENCVVSMEVELWDVVQQKRMMEFRAGGEMTVFLFAYLAALNGAIENSVHTAVEYLKNDGKID